MAETRWYNKRDMVLEARKQHFAASEELIDDWVEKGLLGEAGKRERPGRGQIAQWSEQQLQLFLTLLEHRQREYGKVPIGILCNVPVWKWLYWSGLSDIALLQLRKAMQTWVAFRKRIPKEKIRKDAVTLVKKVGHPRAQEKRALIDELTAIATLKKEVDREELRYRLEPVVVANARGKAQDIGWEEVEYLSTMMPIRLDALRDDDALFQLPDVLWEWARMLLLVTITQRLGGNTVLMEEFAQYRSYYAERLTVNSLCDSACHYLLTLLGIAQQGQFNRESVGYAPHLDPHIWQRREASAAMSTQIVSSSVLLPDRCPVAYLQNDVVITCGREQWRYSLDLPFI